MAQCTICAHPQRDAIEAAHASGISNRRIATQYGVIETSVRRHLANHVAHDATPPEEQQRRNPPKHPARMQPATRRQGQNIPDADYAGLQTDFLLKYIETANITAAARHVGIDRSTVREWQEHDAPFSMRFAEARAMVDDEIYGEIFRRGKLGYEDEVATPKGAVVKVRKYSDRMLELLSRRFPEMREKQQLELSGKDGGPIQTQSQQTVVLDVGGMTTEQLIALRQVLGSDV